MALLILGLAIFLGIHTLTTLRPARAAVIGRLGEGPYKGLYSLASIVGAVLIGWGFSRYRSNGYIEVWEPPAALYPLALALMLVAFVALAAAYSPPGKIKATLRHPMLVAVKDKDLAIAGKKRVFYRTVAGDKVEEVAHVLGVGVDQLAVGLAADA